MDRDNRTRTGAKDPWGRAAPMPLAQRLAEARPGPDTEPDQHVVGKWAKGRCKPRAEAGVPGAGLTAEVLGKARPDRLALKPYRGKPAVRNFREGDGDVGIIRSPVRAIALPDLHSSARRHAGSFPRARLVSARGLGLRRWAVPIAPTREQPAWRVKDAGPHHESCDGECGRVSRTHGANCHVARTAVNGGTASRGPVVSRQHS